MKRKQSTKKQQFWPGSNVIKSSGNAFDWRNTSQGLYSAAELSHIQANVKARMTTDYHPSISTYSKARREELMEKRTTT